MTDGPPFAEFTDEEFAEYFGTPVEESRFRRRRLRGWMKVLGLVAAVGMLAGSVTVLIDQFRNFRSLNDATEIRDQALERIDESPWGWLATDVRIASIPEPEIGGRVRNNPPDGVVMIDLRAWNPDRLNELVDHELGHLQDFAIWNDGGPGIRRGGLESEAWAECAAVAMGTRRIDTGNVDTEYHCYADEFEIYSATMATVDEVCKSWAEPECRPVPAN